MPHTHDVTQTGQTSSRAIANNSSLKGISMPAVVQLKYNSHAVDPTSETDAVALRHNQGRIRNNVSTANISNRVATFKETSVSKSAGIKFHGEREALNKVMNTSKIDGYNNNNGFNTGKSLKEAGIDLVKIYTERPPCKECEPFLKNMEQGMNGDVDVSFSDELEGWYESTNKHQDKIWENHCKKVLGVELVQEEQINDMDLNTVDFDDEILEAMLRGGDQDGSSDSDQDESEESHWPADWDRFHPSSPPAEGQHPEDWAKSKGFPSVADLEYYYNVKNDM